MKTELKIKLQRVKGLYKSVTAMTTPRLSPRLFYGYHHWYFAKQYAKKRFKANGKTNYVLPYGSETLLVANSMELQEMKSQGIINKHYDIKKILEQAFFRANKSNS